MADPPSVVRLRFWWWTISISDDGWLAARRIFEPGRHVAVHTPDVPVLAARRDENDQALARGRAHTVRPMTWPACATRSPARSATLGLTR